MYTVSKKGLRDHRSRSSGRRTNLTYAVLRGADFRNAENLTKGQLQTARLWALSYYDEEQIVALKLPPDHNDRVREKNFSGYDFQGRNLWSANLSEANLQGRT